MDRMDKTALVRRVSQRVHRKAELVEKIVDTFLVSCRFAPSSLSA
jgi:hypothetical protein